MRTTRILFVAAIAFGCGACSTSQPDDGSSGDVPDAADVPFQLPPYVDPYECAPAATPPPLDEPLDGTQSRAGEIRAQSELVRGEGAYGRVGDFKLYNDRVQFVVQAPVSTMGPRRPIGMDLYGGNLIDADRVRRPGERGHDLLREIFPLIGLRVPGANEVRVVCDGSNARAAVVRTLGFDLPSRLLPFDSLARRRYVRIITHYILRPGSEVLEMRTRIDPEFGHGIDSLQLGEFLAFGAGLSLHTPVSGFGDASRNPTPPIFMSAVGDPGENDRRVSYAIAVERGGITTPTVDGSGTAAFYPDISIRAGTFGEFARYFSVGTGDVASAAGPIMRVRGDAHGTVRGTTSPGALVYAYTAPYRVGGAVVSMARSGVDGTFTIPLTPGNYDLIAVDIGHTRGASVSVTVAPGATVMANPMAGPTGTLTLDVAERGSGGGRIRVPMKVTLVGVDVEAPDRAMGSLEGERENGGVHRALFSLSGTESFAVKPGTYRAIASRGPEYDTAEAMVTVAPAGTATVVLDVRRVVDTSGYIAGDYHQHTIGSVDSPRSLCNRVVENVAEGLEHAATTDHDNATDFAPCIRDLSLGSWLRGMIGNEISVNAVGHFNAYPLAVDSRDPYRLVGSWYWADLSPQQLFARIHAENTRPILHISHPRSTFKGYFAYVRLDPTTLRTSPSTPLAMDFHAIEVNESLGSTADHLESNDRELSRLANSDASRPAVLHDYFALINRGHRVCALGNSDTHFRNNGSGYPRNLLRLGVDDPAAVTDAMVRDAIRAQRVIVSNGVVIRVRVDGTERMGHAELVRAVGGMLDLDVEIQAPPWVPTRSFAVFENGRPLVLTMTGAGTFDSAPATNSAGIDMALTTTSAQRFRGTIRVHPSRDSSYVIVVRGGSMRPIHDGDAFGYTNPVYVDTGDGMWTPPIM